MFGKPVRWKAATLVVTSLLAAACSSSGVSVESVDAETSSPQQPAATETTSLPPQPALVYVSVGKDQKVVVLELAVDGTLTARDDLSLSLPGAAGAMTYSESASRLYVGTGNAISTVSLEDSGAPSLLGTTPVDGEPVYLDLATQDRLLAVAFFGEDEVRTYAVGDDPDAYPQAQVDAWDIEPHAIVVNDDGTRAYVPHRNADSVGIYGIDETGALTQQSSVVDLGPGPRHLTLSPDGRFVFVVNEQGDSVTSFVVQPDGNLTVNNTVSTIPEGFDPEGNTGADIHITPDGRYIYASNRGHDSIAMFSVGQDGSITSLGTIETQTRPRDFGMSPDGKFLVVAGQDSGQVESYQVGEDGMLTSVGSVAVGDGPVWVEII